MVGRVQVSNLAACTVQGIKMGVVRPRSPDSRHPLCWLSLQKLWSSKNQESDLSEVPKLNGECMTMKELSSIYGNLATNLVII